jgi:predicted 3'-5' exonuclease similar to PolB exonuclease domain
MEARAAIRCSRAYKNIRQKHHRHTSKLRDYPGIAILLRHNRSPPWGIGKPDQRRAFRVRNARLKLTNGTKSCRWMRRWRRGWSRRAPAWRPAAPSSPGPARSPASVDKLSSFAPHTKASLNELSKIMGLPGKPEGIDGSEVERYFLEGRIKEIADYCEVDVVNTYRVWLRYELFRGRLSASEHQASERNLADFIAARLTPNCI